MATNSAALWMSSHNTIFLPEKEFQPAWFCPKKKSFQALEGPKDIAIIALCLPS